VDPSQTVISVFQTGAATSFSGSSSFILTRAEWARSQTHCYSENLAAPGTEPGASGSAARKTDHRGGQNKRLETKYREESYNLISTQIETTNSVVSILHHKTRVVRPAI
jgi:hypothetical protein